MSEGARYRAGERVEYVGRPVFDGIIWTGDVGTVVDVHGDWVAVKWTAGVHSVPLSSLRVGPPVTTHRVVTDAANRDLWVLFPRISCSIRPARYGIRIGRAAVIRTLSCGSGICSGQACRKTVGRAPMACRCWRIRAANRIFAAAHGTAYALWLTPQDLVEAKALGASAVIRWSNGRVSDLHELVGDGWIWGRVLDAEVEWVKRSYAAVANLGW